MLRDHASERITRRVPGIVAGTCNIAIAGSEPDAGTDLASLKTELFLTETNGLSMDKKCGLAFAIWPIMFGWRRTDPDAPKHRGISMFILPTTEEGFSLSPVHTLGAFEQTRLTMKMSVYLLMHW